MAGLDANVKLTGVDEYKRALKDITQNLKMVSAEMKATASSFDKGDISARQLHKEGKELKSSLKEQEDALKVLSKELKTLESEYSKTASENRELQKLYDEEEKKLDRIGKELGEDSDEYKKQAGIVETLKGQLDKSNQTMTQQEKNLRDLRTQTANAQTQYNKTSDAVENLGNKTTKTNDDVKKSAEGFSSSSQILEGALEELGSILLNSVLNGLSKVKDALVDLTKEIFTNTAEWEQLEGGTKKIFDQMDYSVIEKDAREAYKNMNMSASQYLTMMTSVGATFASTLGDEKGYQVAKQGMQAISDYATGTGKPLDELMQKFTLITRSTSSYQSIADQFSGILPATSKDFLAQAQACGFLSDKYKKLTEVPVAEYQEAVASMLELGTEQLGLHGNTVAEAENTVTGSLETMKASWENLKLAIGTNNGLDEALESFFSSFMTFVDNAKPLLQTIIQNLGVAVVSFLSELIPEIVAEIPPFLESTAPILLEGINNVIGALISLVPQLMPVVTNLVLELVRMFVENTPAFVSAGLSIISSIMEGITEAIPQLIAMLPDLISDMTEVLYDWIPELIVIGMNYIEAIINGILDVLPDLIDTGSDLLVSLIDTFTEFFPQFVETGVQLLTKIIENLPEIIRRITEKLPRIITAIVNALISAVPTLIEAGFKLLVSIVENLPQIVIEVSRAVITIVQGIIKAFSDRMSDIKNIGKRLLEGIWNGLTSAADWLWSKIKGLFSTITNKIKNFFGINSPSKLFRDEIGENLALGLGEGFTEEMANVSKEMQNSIPTSFDVNAGVNGSVGATGGSSFDYLVSAFKEALSEMKIELDDNEVGAFVDRTVSELVYA